MKKIFVHIPDQSGSSYYRASLPISHCYHELSCRGIKLIGDFQPSDAEIFDAYLFHRVIKPDFWQYIQQLIKMRKKIIWQTDDDLWNIPTWNPAFYRVTYLDRTVLTEVVENATSIIVSTDHLSDLIGQHEKTQVLPNLIDCTDFQPYADRNNRPLKILWTGSYTHDEDLQQIIEPMYKVIEKYKSKVQFIFWGYFPPVLFEKDENHFLPKFSPKHKNNVAFLNWVNGRNYFDILARLKPDIALGPLADCEFNYCKSSLKSLEMSMAGAVFIGSKLKPYEWITEGRTGLLVNSDGWFDAICYMVDNSMMRKQMVLNAQEEIRDKYTWQSLAKNQWIDAFCKSCS